MGSLEDIEKSLGDPLLKGDDNFFIKACNLQKESISEIVNSWHRSIKTQLNFVDLFFRGSQSAACDKKGST